MIGDYLRDVRGWPVLAGQAWLRARRASQYRAARRPSVQASWQVGEAELLRALSFSSTTEAHRHFTERSTPRFFIDPRDKRSFAERLLGDCPEAATGVRAEADPLLRREFRLLGTQSVPLGAEAYPSLRPAFSPLGTEGLPPKADIDWHTDFKTGARWDPSVVYLDVPIVNPADASDVKVPWELSRCYQFLPLGRAYWLTGDERYGEEILAEMRSWASANPVGMGVNWQCTMEVAIRLANWTWGYYFLLGSPLLDESTHAFVLSRVLEHARHISRNLEFSYRLRGNHYFADLLGLVYAGLIFPEFDEAAGWRRIGIETMWDEIVRQFHPDGGNFEASIPYHLPVLEMAVLAIALCDLNNVEVPREVRKRISAAVEFAAAVRRPDGIFPQIGDNDNGCVHSFDASPPGSRDFVVDAGSRLLLPPCDSPSEFEREESLWLLGSLPAAAGPRLDRTLAAADTSAAFAETGIYVMRRENDYLIVDCGDVGQGGNGGHAHNDVLSFELLAGAKAFVVDPGTYVYTADFDARNRFRSTAMHNSVRVDGEEINRIIPEDLFRMPSTAPIEVLSWQPGAERDVLEARHEGYRQLANPVTHTRRFTFLRRERTWIVVDELAGEGAHVFEWFLHLDPAVTVVALDDALVLSRPDAAEALVVTDDLADTVWEVETGEYSPGYGTVVKAKVCRLSVKREAPISARLVFSVRSAP